MDHEGAKTIHQVSQIESGGDELQTAEKGQKGLY